MGSSIAINHCVVARVMSGVLVRQQMGYLCVIVSPGRFSRCPVAARCAVMNGVGVEDEAPLKSPRAFAPSPSSAVYFPSSSTGAYASRPWARPVA
jgi:hypothetical protein